MTVFKEQIIPPRYTAYRWSKGDDLLDNMYEQDGDTYIRKSADISVLVEQTDSIIVRREDGYLAIVDRSDLEHHPAQFALGELEAELEQYDRLLVGNPVAP